MAGTLRTLSRTVVKNASWKLSHKKAFCLAPEEARKVGMLAKLTDKNILRIKGRDSAKFMQGIITNDIYNLSSDGDQSLFTMLLNAQGRILFDAFIYRVPGQTDEFFLECDNASTDDIIKHLRAYKLRAKVDIEDAAKDVEPWVLFRVGDRSDIETMCQSSLLAAKDPRLGQLCTRMIVPWNQSPLDFLKIGEHVVVEPAVYKEHRYRLGIAEGMSEITSGNSLPLEYNLALLNGVSFSKGCYIGQELTSRTHHTGQIRKRIMPLQLVVEEKIKSFPVVSSGTVIKTDTGKSAGSVSIMSGKYGLGLVRLKELSEASFLVVTDVDGKEIQTTSSRPDWWPDNI